MTYLSVLTARRHTLIDSHAFCIYLFLWNYRTGRMIKTDWGNRQSIGSLYRILLNICDNGVMHSVLLWLYQRSFIRILKIHVDQSDRFTVNYIVPRLMCVIQQRVGFKMSFGYSSPAQHFISEIDCKIEQHFTFFLYSNPIRDANFCTGL